MGAEPKTIVRYGRVDLLSIDDLGCLELHRRGAELLFQVLTEREGKNSVAIASNESFGRWIRTSDPRLRNVAYGLYPSWRGQGLATRAVQLASPYAASEGAAEAVIRVEPENSVSAAVALLSGFVHRERVCAEDGTWLDWYVRNLGSAR